MLAARAPAMTAYQTLKGVPCDGEKLKPSSVMNDSHTIQSLCFAHV